MLIRGGSPCLFIKQTKGRDAMFRISVILLRSCRMTLEELSRVSQAMASQSYLLCFFYRQAGE
jgi:hypothetical protein